MFNTKPPAPAKPFTLPEPPEHLDERARELWRDIGPTLAESRSLLAADLVTFAGYCQAASEFARMTTILQSEPDVLPGSHGGTIANPRFNLRDKAFKRALEAANALGLTPASRARMGDSFRLDKYDPTTDPTSVGSMPPCPGLRMERGTA